MNKGAHSGGPGKAKRGSADMVVVSQAKGVKEQGSTKMAVVRVRKTPEKVALGVPGISLVISVVGK